ncbi:DUF4336 domain-containing protein [Hoeflea alexandrii]|uniref:DUF4336 domain-containing protein n=1 Tax=Hoeflea alexandrii TaxID=288436 RepID=UPI0022AEF924|nr:DUF4336 domain-containing protein [Hoeflea alexandrii]MCZ4291147.1 DUF4336 domain-containing protein [Hoeflea alexandrii]
MGTLKQLANDIWIADGDIVDFYGFPYPTRCVVVRLADGGLWVWSPIALTSGLRAEIEQLGQPAHLVSPNKIHHLYLQDWHAAYPEARLWGPQSTISKRTDLAFEAPLEDNPPEVWRQDIDQAWFRGSGFLDENVFFHRASQTAIIADMSENFTEDFLRRHWSGWKRCIARVWGIVEGKGYAPLEVRWSFLSRGPLRAARDKVLGWNPKRVVMAHGRIQQSGGRSYLAKAFEWIG